MAQRAKFIDLTRTFVPIDPNSLPETMHGTEGEDRPEQRMPVVPYEGWNFMPTGKGWRSYFGLNAVMGINALETPERCRHVFTFQEPDLSNILVALCDTGVWTKDAQSAGDWTHQVTLDLTGSLLEWSACIIENVLYIYRQGHTHVISYTDAATGWLVNAPTTLNMAGQLGIFKAGNRLGFWDSSNSIAWSSLVDRFDVTPSISTQANITKIVALVGKIINILQHGDGFIIYGTKSIVGVQKNLDNTFLWNAELITGAAGIAYREQACLGAPDTVHYAWTSNSLHKIENFKAEIVVPELYDYLKESQSVIYLKMLEGRYLFLQISDEDYIDGLITFYTSTINGQTITLSGAREAFTLIIDPVTTVTLTSAESLQVYNSFQLYQSQKSVNDVEGDCAGPGYCVGKDYGVYEDTFVIPLSDDMTTALEELAGNKFQIPTITDGGLGGSSPVQQPDFTVITTQMPLGAYIRDPDTIADVAKEYVSLADMNLQVQANEHNFFDKCRMIWDAYNIAARNYADTVDSQLPNGTTGEFDPIFAHNSTVEIYLDVELEFGNAGYTFYCIARPTAKFTKTISYAPGTIGITTVSEEEALDYCSQEAYISYSHPTSFFQYQLNGSTIASPNTPPAYSEAAVLAAAVCALGRDSRPRPTIGTISTTDLQYQSQSMTIGGTTFTVDGLEAINFTFPDATFLMQVGTAAPFDIEWVGAFVYDTHFKRWGKMKATYRCLLDFSPINSTALGTIDYTHFGVNGAMLGSDGLIYLFDTNPTDSYLKFGKIGNFRFGYTTLEEVRADMRMRRTGQLEIETSLDGVSVENALTKIYDFTDARQISQGIGSAGRWHNLAFRGQFDLTYLEFRAWLSSRR